MECLRPAPAARKCGVLCTRRTLSPARVAADAQRVEREGDQASGLTPDGDSIARGFGSGRTGGVGDGVDGTILIAGEQNQADEVGKGVGLHLTHDIGSTKFNGS